MSSISDLPHGVDNQLVEYVGAGENFRQNLQALSKVNRRYNQLANRCLMNKIRRFFPDLPDNTIRRLFRSSDVHVFYDFEKMIRVARTFYDDGVRFKTNFLQDYRLDVYESDKPHKNLYFMNDVPAVNGSRSFYTKSGNIIMDLKLPVNMHSSFYSTRELSLNDKIALIEESLTHLIPKVIAPLAAISFLAYAYFG